MAVGAGLGFVNRRGRLQDAFRARILFPICDPSGHPVALGGRVLPGSSDPAKYKNSMETPIYSKRRTLYALNWAKQDIIESGEVVVCEGYTDVIGFFEAGVERAVATCGTALAEEHVKLLRSFASRVVLAFDADGAGQSAAGRFYEWERRLRDRRGRGRPARPAPTPASWPAATPTRLRAAVEGAKPFLQFRVERILDAADLSTPEGRARAADTALVAVAEHPDNLVRDQYLMQVAERCRLEPLLLRDRLEQLRQAADRDPPGRRPASPPAGPSRRVRRPARRRPGRTVGAGARGRRLGCRRVRRRRSRPVPGRPGTRRGTDGASGPGRPVARVPARARGPAAGHPPAGRCRRPAGGGPVPRRSAAGRLPGAGRRRRPICTRPSTALRPRCGPCWCA